MIIAAALVFAASQIAFAQDDKTKVDPQNVPTAQAPAQEQQKEEAQPARTRSRARRSLPSRRNPLPGRRNRPDSRAKMRKPNKLQ